MYKIPSDMHPATKLIFEEIGKLGVRLVNEERTKIIIMPEDFTHFQIRIGEFTLSSMFGIHYSHYKVAIKCDTSAKILAQQLTVVAKSRPPPPKLEHWSTGHAREDYWSVPSK